MIQVLFPLRLNATTVRYGIGAYLGICTLMLEQKTTAEVVLDSHWKWMNSLGLNPVRYYRAHLRGPR